MLRLAMSGLIAVGTVSAGNAQTADGLRSIQSKGQGPSSNDDEIMVTGQRDVAISATKTDTPLIEVPQPITVITAETYLAQGAINIADTVRYAAGVNADGFGRDTRVDSFNIRGVDALQFRDGMRDIFSFYASITSDPYNFSRVEVVRGPASVLFGQGSLGGLVNLVSKTPTFETGGEMAVTYGSFDRKEVFADLNVAANDRLAARLVVRARDADTYVDHVPDDRIMIAPSVTWRPGANTDLTLLGLYQEDDTGSTANFLPIIGTLRPNGTNPRLPQYLFVGKPGYDRYDGRLLQGTGLLTHRFGPDVTLSLKARYIDSDLDYFTHYTDSYANPTDPYVEGSGGRRIGLFADSSVARLNVFSTDNNLLVRFNTGAAVEHRVLGGVDYSWNAVRKRNGFDQQIIDLYDIDYDIDYDSILEPEISPDFSRESQKQLGIYAQDQIRFWDRVSVVLGVRHDRVRTAGSPDRIDRATTFRAGIIGEIAAGVSPFFSYTESFVPIAGSTRDGAAFRPQTGSQYEAGAKWQPDLATLVTATVFRIRERNRPIPDPANPLGQIQAGELTTKGFELEATRAIPDKFDLTLSYGYNDLSGDSRAFGFAAKHNAAAWAAKTLPLTGAASVRFGAGARYTGKQESISDVWRIVTGDRLLIDALAQVDVARWRLSVNTTNLLGSRYFASCLARGDCFSIAPRNVMASLGYRF